MNSLEISTNFGLIVLCFGLLPACNLGEPSKPLHFYTLEPGTVVEDAGQNDEATTAPDNGVTLSVEKFQGSGIYREKPIIWRDNQHLQRFQFNRWESPPASMLQDVVVNFLRQESGENVSYVYNASLEESNSPYVVRGILRHLYLNREEKNWNIVLHVDLHLLKQDPDKVMSPGPLSGRTLLGRWSLTAEGSTSAPVGEGQTASAMNKLIESLNGNLSREGSRIAREILNRAHEHASSADRESGSTEEENGQK